MSRQHASRYQAPADRFAASRCACKHLIYRGMKPGDPCLFVGEGCNCTDHKPKEVTPSGADHS